MEKGAAPGGHCKGPNALGGLAEKKSMSVTRLSLNAMLSYTVAATLVGCGGVRPPVAAPVAVTQTRHAAAEDLIYVTTGRGVIIVSLRQGTKMGSIPWYSYIGGYVCSDPNTGNVFIPQSNGIAEYTHGATSPSATLSLSGYYVDGGCSVDPTTGNLAQVVVTKGRRPRSEVLVYAAGQSIGRPYSDKRVEEFGYPAYDDAGDLFVTAFVKGLAHRITELAAGKSAFDLVTIPSNDALVTKIQMGRERPRPRSALRFGHRRHRANKNRRRCRHARRHGQAPAFRRLVLLDSRRAGRWLVFEDKAPRRQGGGDMAVSDGRDSFGQILRNDAVAQGRRLRRNR